MSKKVSSIFLLGCVFMTNEFILGLIGSVTGCISFGLTIFRFIEERTNIIIELPFYEGKQSLYFFDAKRLEDHYAKPYRSIIKARIFNDSCRPVHIYEFRLEIKGVGTFVSNEYSVPANTYTFHLDGLNQVDVPISNDLVKPIVEMPAFSVKNGSIFFPRVDELPNDEYQARLIVVSSRKKFFSREFKSKRFTIHRRLNATCEKRDI